MLVPFPLINLYLVITGLYRLFDFKIFSFKCNLWSIIDQIHFFTWDCTHLVCLLARLEIYDWILNIVYTSGVCRLALLSRTSSHLMSPLHKFYNPALTVHFSSSISHLFLNVCMCVLNTGMEARTIFRSWFLPSTYRFWEEDLAASALTSGAISLVLVSIFPELFCVVCLDSLWGQAGATLVTPSQTAIWGDSFLIAVCRIWERDPWRKMVSSRESIGGKGRRWEQAWSLSSKEKAGTPVNKRNNSKNAKNRAKMSLNATLRKNIIILCVFSKSDGQKLIVPCHV